jgi:hypothetical protein
LPIWRIFGPKRDEVIGGWRKLHFEEINYLYGSPCIFRMIKSRRMRWAGDVARMGKQRNAYRILVGKSERKRPLGRPRRRWEDAIKIDLREIGWSGMGCIDLAQDRSLVNRVMNLRVPQNVGKFLSSCATSGFSRRTQLHEVSCLMVSPSPVEKP